jgi:hypothetical protein
VKRLFVQCLATVLRFCNGCDDIAQLIPLCLEICSEIQDFTEDLIVLAILNIIGTMIGRGILNALPFLEALLDHESQEVSSRARSLLDFIDPGHEEIFPIGTILFPG